MLSHYWYLIALKPGPWSQNTNQAIKNRLGGRKQKRTKDYVYGSTSTQRNGTKELWHTILYHLQRTSARNTSVIYTHNRKRLPVWRARREGTERKIVHKKENIHEENEKKASTRSLRAQAESRGDKFAVCWYGQSHDMSSWWANRKTARKCVRRWCVVDSRIPVHLPLALMCHSRSP